MKQCSQFPHAYCLSLVVIMMLVAGCGNQQGPGRGGSHAATADEAQDFERGPHNGRLLRDGDFALEVTIFETGVPPEFRLYPYQNDQPIAPDTVDLTIELGRLGDQVDKFEFYSQGEFLRGDGVVIEPHSFDVTVFARHAGNDSQWHYESYEGRTEIELGVAQAMGIDVAQATSGVIRETIELPHNGRLLRDGDFALEVTIFETGVPPEFRLYPYQNDQPIAPDTVDLTIELGRLGDQVDKFEFYSQGEFLRGDGVVIEPHSFDVTVFARHAGNDSQWHYESYEGRTEIELGVAQAMGIDVAQATSGVIHETIELQGTVSPHPNAVTEVRGRFPGLVQSLQKAIGDSVRQGEALASVQLFDAEILPRANTILKEIRAGYSVGRFSHLELVTAQAELLAARNARLTACSDHQLRLIDIERLTGGGSVWLADRPGVSP